MGPVMSMVTCSVTSVTTTVSSVFFAHVLVSYIVHTDHGFFSGICCNLKSFWIIPCQSWQWTRSGGIVKTVDFRIQQILKSTFVNILHLKDFELVDGADLDLETPWTRSANRRSFSSPFSSCDAISSPEQFDSSAWIGILSNCFVHLPMNKSLVKNLKLEFLSYNFCLFLLCDVPVSPYPAPLQYYVMKIVTSLDMKWIDTNKWQTEINDLVTASLIK